VVHQSAEALKAGDTVAFFPEGTTSDGHHLLPFHANLLQAAVSSGAPVQPIALRFSEPGHAVSPSAAYIGETTLVQSLWMIACASGIEVHVDVLNPVASEGLDRRALVQAVRGRIAEALGLPDAAHNPP
jgi:1-acyl-sn-glycerol-3-phosphate acyltransferase